MEQTLCIKKFKWNDGPEMDVAIIIRKGKVKTAYPVAQGSCVKTSIYEDYKKCDYSAPRKGKARGGRGKGKGKRGHIYMI